MPKIMLKDILINARQESYRMRHFYLGVEHLFIALLEIRGGLASSILEEQGLSPEYVIDAVRRKVGKGSRHRLWAGIPNTPRGDIVLNIARDIALEAGRNEITERDLLVAICDEDDSMPVRVLKRFGIDMKTFAEAARTRTLARDSQQPYITVDFGADFDRKDALSKEQLFILRRMFYGYDKIRVDRRLTGGYSNAVLLVVTPMHGDNREDAAVVVKIDATDQILDEAQRYETHVKGTLPPLTARLEDKPTAPETSDVAGIKYTLVVDADKRPQDLRVAVRELGAAKLGQWLHDELFTAFGALWWRQNRPFRFEVWAEYDWLLPPTLTLEVTQDSGLPSNAHILKMPIKRSKLKQLEYGDIVSVENFTVQQVYRDKNVLALAAGDGSEAAKRAHRIEVRGLDLRKDTYYRGEIVEGLIGRVWKTRQEVLMQAARALEPDFDLRSDTIPLGEVKLPNPLLAYDDLLDRQINGSLSKIHSDLHLGNILVGPNQSACLIDFGHTRDGHTLFDWATLEVSLLSDVVLPVTGEESWDAARRVLSYVAAVNAGTPLPEGDARLDEAMSPVTVVRSIAQECLAEGNWVEYYIPLALCALRATTWETMALGGRRLMFLVAAQSIHEVQQRSRPRSESGVPAPDETDVTDSR